MVHGVHNARINVERRLDQFQLSKPAIFVVRTYARNDKVYYSCIYTHLAA